MNEEKITLKNILGYKDEKESVQKIITLLNNYEKYSKEGVSIPRGLIFQGPPGTGKTLFAKAIAGECKYKFLTAFKNDMDENPLSTLKAIFKEAEAYSSKTGKPSLIYIDEIDKITHVNVHGELSDKDAREATRFLLQKLDETKLKNKILVIASTNNYGKIPYALLRSGRFDKKILINVPDLQSRIDILKYYIGDKPLFKNINITRLALKTKGMSGADLKTLINNTLVEYITTKQTIVDEDFIKIIQEMHFETIGKEWDSKDKVFEVLVHEAGHSIVSGELTNDYGQISALKYGDVGGNTTFDDDLCEDELVDFDGFTFKNLLDDITISFGGMAAEMVLLKQRSVGGHSDICQVASRMCYLFDVGIYGFKYSADIVTYTESTKEARRKLGVKLANKMFKKACKIVKKNRELILFLVDEIHKHNDVMSSKQIKENVDYFKEHKKELTKKYRNFKMGDFK